MKTLKEYAKYLRDTRLSDYTAYYLAVIEGMDNTVSKRIIKDMSEKNAGKKNMESQKQFLLSLENGTVIDNAKKMWEEDKSSGTGENEILPSDLVLLYAAQKKAVFNFLLEYTADARECVTIMQELEDLYAHIQYEALSQKPLYSAGRSEASTGKREIDKEMNQLNQKLTKSVMELEVANKELESFSYSVSHDLRAPLRAISGYTKILLDDYGVSLEEDAVKMMHSVSSNALRMNQLIDDLLAFSRIGKKEINLREINMTEIAKTSLDAVKMEHNNNVQARVIVNDLLPALADNSLMENVFTNLISNAIKYSSQQKAPLVEISSYNKDGENIYLVKDNGVGFDMKYYDKLFGVFQRLHNISEFAGTGVGLALVKRIITRHGGRVWAEAEPNKGATFYIALQSITN